MKILLIDDHVLFRDGLLLMLEGLKMPIETFEAGSYEAAKKVIDEHSDIDLILLDLDLPGTGFFEALASIRKQQPESAVVILSGTEDHQTVEQALQYGARGYIPKSSSTRTMLNALQLVLAGDTYIPGAIFNTRTNDVSNTATAGAGKTAKDELPGHKLTPRQYDVLKHLAEGKSNKEIGRALYLTESTIRAHVAAILRSFDVSNRTQAVRYAVKNAWISVD